MNRFFGAGALSFRRQQDGSLSPAIIHRSSQIMANSTSLFMGGDVSNGKPQPMRLEIIAIKSGFCSPGRMSGRTSSAQSKLFLIISSCGLGSTPSRQSNMPSSSAFCEILLNTESRSPGCCGGIATIRSFKFCVRVAKKFKFSSLAFLLSCSPEIRSCTADCPSKSKSS